MCCKVHRRKRKESIKKKMDLKSYINLFSRRKMRNQKKLKKLRKLNLFIKMYHQLKRWSKDHVLLLIKKIIKEVIKM